MPHQEGDMAAKFPKIIGEVIILLGITFLFACGAPTPEVVEVITTVEVVKEVAKVVEAKDAQAPQPATGSGEEGKAGVNLLSLPANQGRMILKDGLIKLLVEDTARTINQVTDLAITQGGYLISSRSWYQNNFQYAEIKLGVPSLVFEDTMNYLRKIGIRVLDETVSGQDVSAEYNDLQSRLSNLEATAARVREFLDQAKTVEESLNINKTLSDLEAEIEQVKGQMKFYEGRAAYSTITIEIEPQIPTPTPTLTPTITPTPTPRPTPTPVVWRPGETVSEAAKISVDLMKDLVDLIIWVVIVLGPFGLVAALFIWLWWRYLRPKRKSKLIPPPTTPPATPGNS